MRRTPRLVATDLDGTLVRSDNTVSAYTQRVLAELDEGGVPVVFVTGRPLRWAEDVFDHVGRHGLAVISNGALVWDVAKREPVLTRTIDPVVGVEVCELIRAAVPGSAFAIETLDGTRSSRSTSSGTPCPTGAGAAPIAELFTEPALKILARHEELGYQEFWDRAAAAIGDRAVVTWSSTSSLLEISAAGVTKATTLAVLCDDLKIAPDEVIAFGDMPNDLAMLAWAGTSYAMADAHPTVVAAAAHLAPGHDEDGVARVLASVFGLDPTCGRIVGMAPFLQRLLVLLVIGLATVVVADAPAHAACTCQRPPLAQQVNQADGVFSGTVTMASGPTTSGKRQIMSYDVKVDRVYKGDISLAQRDREVRRRPVQVRARRPDRRHPLPVLRAGQRAQPARQQVRRHRAARGAPRPRRSSPCSARAARRSRRRPRRRRSLPWPTPNRCR